MISGRQSGGNEPVQQTSRHHTCGALMQRGKKSCLASSQHVLCRVSSGAVTQQNARNNLSCNSSLLNVPVECSTLGAGPALLTKIPGRAPAGRRSWSWPPGWRPGGRLPRRPSCTAYNKFWTPRTARPRSSPGRRAPLLATWVDPGHAPHDSQQRQCSLPYSAQPLLSHTATMLDTYYRPGAGL